MSRSSLYDLPFSALEQEIASEGLRPAHAGELWRMLYRGDVMDRGARADLPPPLQWWMEKALGENGRFSTDALSPVGDIKSSDGFTRKFLLRLADGESIETVLMGYPGRFTACVSTQAGCAMGCVFCATGQMGFARHLRPAEIVAQVLHARRALRIRGEGKLRNLVLMGMGEPLHNYDAVMAALEIITDSRGIGLGPRRITISTVGVVPGILRMAAEARPYHLAVSLHDSTDEGRAALVPAGRRWPLGELLSACRAYGRQTGRRIFFEWTLIAGSNDSTEKARELAAILAGMDAHVNLIPLNPTQGFAGEASEAPAAAAFQRVLREAGIPSTVRQRRGIDVAAGCGQLQAEQGRPRPVVAPMWVTV